MPGGFGERGIEGKVDAIRFAREHGIPFFGICLGMQCAVAEFARNVLGLERANSTEFDKTNPHPVICLLDEQRSVTDMGGTMRLGAQPAKLDAGSTAARCYGTETISERHRHRYEFNNAYRQQFEAGGMQHRGHQPRRRAWWRLSKFPNIPGSWPYNIIRSSSRSLRGRIPCSPALSPPRSNIA